MSQSDQCNYENCQQSEVFEGKRTIILKQREYDVSGITENR
jgi:hypothetical protein